MSATIHDIFCERERRNQCVQQATWVAQQWERYEDVIQELQDMPGWMLLKVMTACRLRLKEK